MATRRPARYALAIVLGNFIQFYDFLAFSFFAVQIGQTFFPSGNPATSLLASLATFGVGFFARPVGAFVLGRLADRRGRKPVLLLSFALTGTATVGLALTPAHAQIGLAAPILVIGFRLLQGFAVGGEIGASLAYLSEIAPPGRRGLYVSLYYASADAAILIGGILGAGMALLLDDSTLDRWGWRVAFLVGGVIVALSLQLRRSLPETSTAGPEPAGACAPPGRRLALLGFGMIGAAATVQYILIYLGTYARTALGLPTGVAFGATAVVGVSGLIADPLSGWLADKIGCKPVMIAPWVLLTVGAIPAFHFILLEKSAASLYAVTAILMIATALSSTAAIVALTEALPRSVRSSTVSIAYALGVSIFGGSTQFIVAWLVVFTNNPLAPGWYMIAAAAVGLALMAMMPDPIGTASREGGASQG